MGIVYSFLRIDLSHCLLFLCGGRWWWVKCRLLSRIHRNHWYSMEFFRCCELVVVCVIWNTKEYGKHDLIEIFRIVLFGCSLHFNFTLSLLFLRCKETAIFPSMPKCKCGIWFESGLNSVNFGIIRWKKIKCAKTTTMTACTRFNVCVFLTIVADLHWQREVLSQHIL